MAAVARMYYLDDLDQLRIADLVGVSRSKVSRLLSGARRLESKAAIRRLVAVTRAGLRPPAPAPSG